MSRIGRAPITVPAGVEVKVDGQHVSVKGPKGALEMNVAPTMKVEVEAGVVHVTRPNDDKMNRSLHGLKEFFSRRHAAENRSDGSGSRLPNAEKGLTAVGFCRGTREPLTLSFLFLWSAVSAAP